MDLEAYLAEQSRQGRFSGTALVRHTGTTLLDAGYGFAWREAGRSNMTETTFQLASVSKQFAAAAILLLQEQGALSVSDPLSRWFPGCPEDRRRMTIHHLLTHTSGVGHWTDFPTLSLYAPTSRGNLLGIIQQGPLKFSPGSGWAYSSPGYVLLAHIVEQVSGDAYGRFLQRAIFRRLGMTRSAAGDRAPLPEQQAIGYAGETALPSFNLETVSIGAGDIWSTTGDLACWDASLMTPGMLLSENSLGAMFSPHVAVTGAFRELPGARYGYGWLVASELGQRFYVHPGDNSGFGALNIIVPAVDAIVVLLSNDEDVDLWPIGRHLLRAMLRRT